MLMMHSRDLVVLILIDFYRYSFISVIYIRLTDRCSIFQKCEDASRNDLISTLKRINKNLSHFKNIWIPTDRPTDQQKDRWVHCWTDRWMDIWMDGQITSDRSTLGWIIKGPAPNHEPRAPHFDEPALPVGLRYLGESLRFWNWKNGRANA